MGGVKKAGERLKSNNKQQKLEWKFRKGKRLSLDTPDLKLLKNSASSFPHQVSSRLSNVICHKLITENNGTTLEENLFELFMKT